MLRSPALLIMAFPVTLTGQSQRLTALQLRPANATLKEEFTTVSSVRELRDGRLVITDRLEQRALVADFRRGGIATVARRGQGPGEFASPPQIFPLAADSSLLVARTQRRWILLHGSRVALTVPPDAAAIRESRGLVLGTDTMGHVLTTRSPRQQPGTTVVSAGDSLELLLIERATGRSDTVASLSRMTSRSSLKVDAQGREVSASFDRIGVMPTEEVATIFPDGAIAVARLNPFRVDWRLPNGSWVRGNPVPVRLVNLDARQKQWYMKAIAGYGKPQPPESLSGWPREIPPFLSTAGPLLPSPDGRLLIRRTRDADHQGTRYLVVNRRGNLDGEISLEPSQAIAGFGVSSAFVLTTNADGIQVLSRHPWP